jgi:hypothetical protein
MRLSRITAGSRSVAMLTALVVVIGGAALSAAPQARAAAPDAGSFTALSPARILDTRTGNGAPQQAVAAGHTVAVPLTGRGGVPATGVSAVSLNVVVTGATGTQGVTVSPDGVPLPGLVTFNYGTGPSTARLVVSRVGADGKVDLTVSGTGSVQLLADVTGYYAAGTPTTAGSFGTVSQTRVLDTRTGNGAPRQAVPAGHAVALQITGRGGVPATGVSAVALDVVVAGATGAQSVTVYPDGTARPGLVTMNYGTGPSTAHLVISRVSADGKVDLLVGGTGTVQLLADVTGYYLAGAPTAVGSFTALAPARILDTRTGNGAPQQAVAAGHGVAVQITGRGGVPATGVAAVALNVVEVSATGPQGVTVHPDGGTRPGLVSMNYGVGSTTAHLVISKIGADGKVDLYVSGAGTVQLLADVAGYYQSPPLPSLSWSAPADIEPFHGGLRAVSCVSSSFCAAVDGTGNALTFDGAHWSSPVDLDGHAGLAGVSCVSASFCVAVEWAGKALTFDGTNWSGPVLVDPHGSSGVSCVSSSYCMAVDSQYYAVTYDGASWTQMTSLPLQGMQSISCASASSCRGASGNSSMFWDGTFWSGVRYPASSTSCVSSTFCVAVDGQGDVDVFSGRSRVSHTNVDTVALTSVSCASPSFCVAVDLAGNALTFDGTTWSSPAHLDGSLRFPAVSCASPSFCAAVGADGNVVTFDGSTWGAPVVIDPVSSQVSPVSCATQSFCMAVDDGGAAMSFDGSTWSAPASIDSTGLTAVSCVSASFCKAVDKGGRVLTYTAGNWSAPLAISGVALTDISCASISICVATDSSGAAESFDGTRWTTTPNLFPLFSSYYVSCAAPTFCLAVDTDGRALTFDGAVWSAPLTVASGAEFESVSCVSAWFCVAITDMGQAFVRDAAGWSPPFSVAESGQVPVSCNSPSFCVSVGTNGQAQTFNGTTWSAPVSVGLSTVRAMSCAAERLCVVVGINDIATAGTA